MPEFDDHRFRFEQKSPATGSASTERHAGYHGPARRRGWVIAAIAVALVAIFVVLLALNPTANDEPPAGIASTESARLSA